MNTVDGDAEEEKTDADFESGCGESVEDLAEEPVLRMTDVSIIHACCNKETHHQTHLGGIIIQKFPLFTVSMSNTAKLRDQICEDEPKCYHHSGIIPTSLTSKNLRSVKGCVSEVQWKRLIDISLPGIDS